MPARKHRETEEGAEDLLFKGTLPVTYFCSYTSPQLLKFPTVPK
jgi:hypothetical protein